jgi:hypothetical protein
MATTPLRPGTAPANAPACIVAAEQFMAIGGRLLIDPLGRFESSIDVGLLVRSGNAHETVALRNSIARAFLRVIRRSGTVTRLT